MDGGYDRHSSKRDITLSLNEEILRGAQSLPGNLSERVERFLAAEIERAERGRDGREARLDSAIADWIEFDEKHGSFADQFIDDIL